jgi:hypothetical protein
MDKSHGNFHFKQCEDGREIIKCVSGKQVVNYLKWLGIMSVSGHWY